MKVLMIIFTLVFNPFAFFSGRFTQTKKAVFFNKHQQAIFILALLLTGLLVVLYYHM